MIENIEFYYVKNEWLYSFGTERRMFLINRTERRVPLILPKNIYPNYSKLS